MPSTTSVTTKSWPSASPDLQYADQSGMHETANSLGRLEELAARVSTSHALRQRHSSDAARQ